MGWIFLFRVHALIRDSPAYAGNTVPRAVKEILDQDHPRLRGEYERERLNELFDKGSPPLARGIRISPHSKSASNRITPACAGNTPFRRRAGLLCWDHPRLRGEYAELYLKQPQKQGSPPLARGILPAALPIFGAIGITPACAGNTNYVNDSRWNRRDHPRLRGEYPRRHLPRMSCLGSPPLARGIPPGCIPRRSRHRITPACAGNT